MKDPKEKKTPDRVETLRVVRSRDRLQGELKFKGSFRIDRFFKGKIDSDGTLIIGEQGNVEAEVPRRPRRRRRGVPRPDSMRQ